MTLKLLNEGGSTLPEMQKREHPSQGKAVIGDIHASNVGQTFEQVTAKYIRLAGLMGVEVKEGTNIQMLDRKVCGAIGAVVDGLFRLWDSNHAALEIRRQAGQKLMEIGRGIAAAICARGDIETVQSTATQENSAQSPIRQFILANLRDIGVNPYAVYSEAHQAANFRRERQGPGQGSLKIAAALSASDGRNHLNVLGGRLESTIQAAIKRRTETPEIETTKA